MICHASPVDRSIQARAKNKQNWRYILLQEMWDASRNLLQVGSSPEQSQTVSFLVTTFPTMVSWSQTWRQIECRTNMWLRNYNLTANPEDLQFTVRNLKLFPNNKHWPLLQSGDTSIHLGKKNMVASVEQCHSHGSRGLFLEPAHWSMQQKQDCLREAVQKLWAEFHLTHI